MLNTRKTPLSSARTLYDRVSAVTDQAPHEHAGMNSLQLTMKSIHIYSEKCQLTVRNTSPELLKCSGEQYCMQWKHPELGEFSELDFAQDNSVYTLTLKKIYLETLNNRQGLFFTVYLEMTGTSSCTLILGVDGLSNFSFFSEFYMIIYTKYENVIRKLLQYVLGFDLIPKLNHNGEVDQAFAIEHLFTLSWLFFPFHKSA